MIDYEYILKIDRKDIDIINKITEAYEGIGNIRTVDSKIALVKILTNSYFLKDVDDMLDKIRRELNVKIELIEKREWMGEI